MTPKIDAHQHFWKYSPDTHAWIDDSMSALRRDFLPEDLSPLLRAAGVDGTVAVQAQQSLAETEWLLRLAEESPFIRGVVGWVDLCAPDARASLARFAAHPRFLGVRHGVQDEPRGFMTRPDFRRGIAALAGFDLAYDILIYPGQLEEAADLVEAFPQQRFVIDHSAKPAIREREFDSWSRDMARLARSSNVYCKLSGLVTEADWTSWTPEDLAPYIDRVLGLFGPDRVMIGSDWPVCTLAAAYSDVLAVPIDRIGALSAPDREAVLGGTAVRFYRLR
jgi:L-fuconolactonase